MKYFVPCHLIAGWQHFLTAIIQETLTHLHPSNMTYLPPKYDIFPPFWYNFAPFGVTFPPLFLTHLAYYLFLIIWWIIRLWLVMNNLICLVPFFHGISTALLPCHPNTFPPRLLNYYIEAFRLLLLLLLLRHTRTKKTNPLFDPQGASRFWWAQKQNCPKLSKF